MNTIVVGPSRSGKTFLTKRLLHLMSKDEEKQILIFDQQLSYAVVEDGGFENIEIYDTNVITRENITKLSIVKIMKKALANHDHVLINTAALSVSELSILFDLWMPRINKDFQNLIIVFEEAYKSVPRYRSSKELQNLVRNSAKKGIDMLFVYQSAVDTDIQLTRQAHFAFLFSPTNEDDRIKLRNKFRMPDTVDFSMLKQHECIAASLFDNQFGIVKADQIEKLTIEDVQRLYDKVPDEYKT